MPYRDVREFIKRLEDEGELVRVKAEVDWDQELSAVFVRASKEKNRAILFEKVKGSGFPVLIGQLTSSKRVELAFERNSRELDDEIENLLNIPRNDFPPVIVERGKSQEVVLTGDDVDLLKFPVPKFNPKEGGRYITAGVSISKDPETGARNAGIYRMMVRDKNEINVNFGFPNRHMLRHFQKREKEGKPLDVAVVIGCDPAVWLCAALPLAGKIDEVAQAGAVRGKAVEMVKCRTVDLEVLADAETVLEGELLPNTKKPEGPYVDFQGYYTKVKDNYVIRIKCITHRKDAIFETSMTGQTPEGEMEVYRYLLSKQQKAQLKKALPQIVDFTFDSASMGHIYVVSVRKEKPFVAKEINEKIWTFPWSIMIKMLVVVDEDIDVNDPSQVMWALATRVDFEKDIILNPKLQGPSFDVATAGRQSVAKVTIDATMKLQEEGYPAKFPEPGKSSKEIIEKVMKRWGEYGIR